MSKEIINVLILDDSGESRRILSEVVSAMPRSVLCGAGVVGPNGFARIGSDDIDLILLAATAGIQTVRNLKTRYPHLGIIVVSDAVRREAELALASIDAGALGFVRRPAIRPAGDGQAELVRQIFPLICTYHARRAAHETREHIAASRKLTQTAQRPPKPPSRPLQPARRIDLVAIGISAGGPEALQRMVPMLPASLGVPILVVQHMPPVFTRTLAERLNSMCAMPVREAEAGSSVEPDVLLIAPGGYHMVLERAPRGGFQIELDSGPLVHGCRPSVDVLFQSIAQHAIRGVLSVIMTGMGSDGCDGVRAIKALGGYCISQDEASSSVFGMPKAIEDAGLSDEQVPLDRLAFRIAAIVGASRAVM
ncbi:MAG: chemotaxis response regulator protein-glutamate methylesterase [Candidatus Hydrogenedentota bacterium]